MNAIDPILVGAGGLFVVLMVLVGIVLGALVPLGAKPAPAAAPPPALDPLPSVTGEPPALQPVVLPGDPPPTIVVQQPPLCVDVVTKQAEPVLPWKKHGKKHKKHKGDAGDVVAGLLIFGILAAIFGGGGKK